MLKNDKLAQINWYHSLSVPAHGQILQLKDTNHPCFLIKNEYFLLRFLLWFRTHLGSMRSIRAAHTDYIFIYFGLFLIDLSRIWRTPFICYGCGDILPIVLSFDYHHL